MIKDFDYTKKERELEEILADLQSPSLDVEASVEKYKQGLLIVEEIEKYLKNTKNKIEELKKEKGI